MDEGFEVISDIYDIEVIAIGRRIRDLRRLKRSYGDGRWLKLKGSARFNCRTEQSRWQKFTGIR